MRIALALGLVLAFILWVMAQYPPPVDSDGDGLTDDEELSRDFSPLWQAYSNGGFDEYLYYIAWAEVMCAPPSSPSGMFTDPFETDTDGDGLSDYEELYDVYGNLRRPGTNPLMFDTDRDGVDDKTEIDQGYDPCYPDVVDPGVDSNGDGIPDWSHLLAGEDPFAPPADPFLGETAQDIEAWSLTPSINIPVVPPSMYGMTVYSKTVTVNKTGPWQLFFISGAPDGWGNFTMYGYVSYEVDGVPLWAGVSSGTHDPFHVPLGDGQTNASVTVTLAVPSDGHDYSVHFSPVYLLRWSPGVNFQSSFPAPAPLVETVADGIRHVVTTANDTEAVFHYELDISRHPWMDSYYGTPYSLPLPASELEELNNPPIFFAPGLSLFSPMDAYGRGTVSIPSYACVATVNAPDADHPVRLVFIKPEVTRSGPGIPQEPLGPLSGPWPLDSASQQKQWSDTFAAAGVSAGDITVTTGLEGFDLPPGLLNVSIGGIPGSTAPIPVPSVQPAGGGMQTLGTGGPDDPCDCSDATGICVECGGTVVWSNCDGGGEDDSGDTGTGGDDDDYCDGTFSSCGDDPTEDECGCVGVDGAEQGSFKFRVSLGGTENGTPAGFVWLALDTPQPVIPSLFNVLPAPGVDVSSGDGVTTVEAPERKIRIEPAGGGSRLTVLNPRDNDAALAVWLLSNPSDSAVRVVKKDGAGGDAATASDETFTFDALSGEWTRADSLRGVTETLVTETSPDGRSKTDTREVRDNATGALLSRTSETRELIGAGAKPVARVTARATLAGGSSFLYWEDLDNPRRNGKRKLRTGTASDWQYRHIDDLGRPALIAGPLDGSLSGGIGALEPSTPGEFAAHGIDCLATVFSHAPDFAAGDSGHPADRDRPRESIVYAVRDGAATAVSRIRRLYTRGTDAETGYPTLTVQTTRYADPSSLIIHH